MNPKRLWPWATIGILTAALLAIALGVTPSLAAPLSDDPAPPEGEANPYCTNLGQPVAGPLATTLVMTHPVGGRLAATYGITYTDVMSWFCQDHRGFGEIMLALSAAKFLPADSGVDPATLLAQRESGLGWGQIWHELGFNGRPGNNGQGHGQNPNADLDPETAADDAGPSVPVDHGRPADKGLPPGQDRAEGAGPPGLTNHPVHPDHGGGHGKP